MRIHGEPLQRLFLALLASWVLHGALVLVVWGSLLRGTEPPSLGILELIVPPEPGPAAPMSSPRPSPPRGRAAVPRPDPRRGAAASLSPAPPPVQVAAAAEEMVDAGRGGERVASDGVGVGPAAAPRSDVGDGAAAVQGNPLTGPHVGYQMIPRYPESARRLGVQGTTVLKVRVLADGSVGEIIIDRSAGHADLDDAAVDALRHWRFKPARRGAELVPVWILIPIRFRLG